MNDTEPAPQERLALPPGCERPPRPDEELKQIAVDLHAGKIYTSQHLKDPNLMGSVFMPLALMSLEDHIRLIANGETVMFEYMHKAGPLMVNDHPGFFSMQCLTDTEWRKVLDYWRAIEKAVAGV